MTRVLIVGDGTRVPELESLLASQGFDVELVHGAPNALSREREARQRELENCQTEKLDAIAQFAGGVAHDFNSLLAVIKSYGFLLADALPQGARTREDIDQILLAADAASSLTRQLLAFSRKQPLKPELVEINALVADLEKPFRRLLGEGIEFSCELDPMTASVFADVAQLQQVLVNLVTNAREAMPNGGKFTIRTENQLSNEGVDPESGGQGYVVISITDTGFGMTEETKRRIFEPFFTTKAPGKGTGIGLSTAWGIVRQSGGRLSVRSELGRGAEFRIHWPRHDETR